MPDFFSALCFRFPAPKTAEVAGTVYGPDHLPPDRGRSPRTGRIGRIGPAIVGLVPSLPFHRPGVSIQTEEVVATVFTVLHIDTSADYGARAEATPTLGLPEEFRRALLPVCAERPGRCTAIARRAAPLGPAGCRLRYRTHLQLLLGELGNLGCILAVARQARPNPRSQPRRAIREERPDP